MSAADPMNAPRELGRLETGVWVAVVLAAGVLAPEPWRIAACAFAAAAATAYIFAVTRAWPMLALAAALAGLALLAWPRSASHASAVFDPGAGPRPAAPRHPAGPPPCLQPGGENVAALGGDRARWAGRRLDTCTGPSPAR